MLHSYVNAILGGMAIICVNISLLSPLSQVLQGNGVTISFIIPSLIGLDKTLESRVTNYTHFNKALRTGLHTHFQPVIHQKDMILATVLDPRIKMQVLN